MRGPVRQYPYLIVLLVGHKRIKGRGIFLFVRNDLPDQVYGGIMLVPVPGLFMDHHLLQGGVGYGQKDGQWARRAIRHMHGDGSISAGAYPDVVRAVTENDVESSLRIRQAALPGAHQADAGIGQGKMGKGVEDQARDDPRLRRGGTKPQEVQDWYSDKPFDGQI